MDWILCGPDGLDGAPSMLLESILGGVGVPYHQLALKDAMAVPTRPIAAKASHFLEALHKPVSPNTCFYLQEL